MNYRTGWGCDDSDDECHGLIDYEKQPVMEPMPTQPSNSDLTDFPLKMSTEETEASKNIEIDMAPTSLNISEQVSRNGIDSVYDTVDSNGTVIQNDFMSIDVPMSQINKIHVIDEQEEKFEVEQKAVNPSNLIGAGMLDTSKDENLRVLGLFKNPVKLGFTKSEFDNLRSLDKTEDEHNEKEVTNKESKIKPIEADTATKDEAEESTVSNSDAADPTLVSKEGNGYLKNSGLLVNETDNKKKMNENERSHSFEISPTQKKYKNKLANIKKGKRKYLQYLDKPDYEFVSEKDDLERAKKHKFKINFV